jgi:hypothetical protein
MKGANHMWKEIDGIDGFQRTDVDGMKILEFGKMFPSGNYTEIGKEYPTLRIEQSNGKIRYFEMKKGDFKYANGS